MPNYYYQEQEWECVYKLTTDSYWSDGEIDCPDELYEEYIKAEEQFKQVQSKITKLLLEQNKIQD